MQFWIVWDFCNRSNIITPQELITGGDDYELALAVAPENVKIFMKELASQGLYPQDIGEFTPGPAAVTVRDKNGRVLNIKKSGWRHF